MRSITKACLFGVAVVFLSVSISYGSIVTYFAPANAGNGVYASATATVTTGVGFVDIVIQNTSPLGGTAGQYKNPYITEIELAYLDGLEVASGSVTSKAGSYFAQGTSVAALYTADAKTLNYNVVAPDTAKMKKCLMSYANADNNQNDNTVASMNVLNGAFIPQDNTAVGFLDPKPTTYSGAVFDTVTFHINFTTNVQIDESYYAAPETLVVKYQGYGTSYHAYNIPEPATMGLLSLGGLLLRRRN